jgi:hypothetical protein
MIAGMTAHDLWRRSKELAPDPARTADG